MEIEIVPPRRGRPKKGQQKAVYTRVIHKLWIVHPTAPTKPIVECECEIVVTGKITWAEPVVLARGMKRDQKRYMVGAFAFYTRQQAVEKKIKLLLSLMKARGIPRVMDLAWQARQQVEQYQLTGEIK